jgi:hypothetical protein
MGCIGAVVVGGGISCDEERLVRHKSAGKNEEFWR